MKTIGKNFFSILFLLAILVLFFSPYLFSENIPYSGDFTGSDLTELNLPLRFLAAESFRQGQVPLWTNLLSNGFPVLAEGQAGVFYPFNIILFTLLPFDLAFEISLILNFFLAGLFIYLYSRSLKISHFGSILVALTFSFSGFFIFRFKHLNYINAAVWLPLEFYLVEKFFLVKRKYLLISILSLVLATQFFAGSPPFFYVSLVSLFLYFCLKIFLGQKPEIKSLFPKLIYPWLLLGILVFGLTAIQSLPTFFNSTLSSRSISLSYEDAVAFPYKALSLLYFIFPYISGNPAFNTYSFDIRDFGIFWENNIYFGILPLLFSLSAIFILFTRNKNIKILTVLLFISFLFVFGDSNPMFIAFWNILPGLKMFRFPQRFLLLGLICFTVLAGFGFDYFWQKLKDWQTGRSKVKSKMLIKFLLPILIILFVAVDLFVFAFKYVGALDYSKYFSAPRSAEFLAQDKEYFNIYSVNWPQAWGSIKDLSGGWQNNLSLFIIGRELIPPNLNVFWNIPSAQDRASIEGGMLNKEFHQLTNRLWVESWLNEDENGKIIVADQPLKIFGAQNVKYFLSFKSLENDNLELAKEFRNDFLPPLKIYQNKYFLPFAFGVFEVKIANSPEESLELIFDPEFDPAKQIILTSGYNQPVSKSDNPQGIIKMIDLKPGEISVQADFSDPGYLFLAQVFYPGWQAHLDGQKVEVIRANYAFSAVKMPKGEHDLIFYYQPPAYLVGKWLSLLTFFSLLVSLVFYFWTLKVRSIKN